METYTIGTCEQMCPQNQIKMYGSVIVASYLIIFKSRFTSCFLPGAQIQNSCISTKSIRQSRRCANANRISFAFRSSVDPLLATATHVRAICEHRQLCAEPLTICSIVSCSMVANRFGSHTNSSSIGCAAYARKSSYRIWTDRRRLICWNRLLRFWRTAAIGEEESDRWHSVKLD